MIKQRGAIGVIGRDDGCLLVIERSRTVRAPGRFCFPGGATEAGESEQDAVKRELREELSLDVVPVRRLWKSQTRSGVELNWWLATMLMTQIPVPDPAEVARYFWMQPQAIVRHPATLLTNREFLSAVRAGQVSLGDDAAC